MEEAPSHESLLYLRPSYCALRRAATKIKDTWKPKIDHDMSMVARSAYLGICRCSKSKDEHLRLVNSPLFSLAPEFCHCLFERNIECKCNAEERLQMPVWDCTNTLPCLKFKEEHLRLVNKVSHRP